MFQEIEKFSLESSEPTISSNRTTVEIETADELQNFQSMIIENKRSLVIKWLLDGKSVKKVSTLLNIEEIDIKKIYNSWYKEQMQIEDTHFTSKHLLLSLIVLLTLSSMSSISEVLNSFVPFEFVSYLLAISICLSPIVLLIHPTHEETVDSISGEVTVKNHKIWISVTIFLIVFCMEVLCNAIQTNSAISKNVEAQTSIWEVTNFTKFGISWIFAIALPSLAALFEFLLLRTQNEKRLFVIKKAVIKE